MKHKKHYLHLIFFLLCGIFFSTSCTTKTEAQKFLGPDADYFIGLTLLKAGNEKAALSRFNHCLKKGTYYCAKESAKEICKIGTLQNINKACDKLLSRFYDIDSLITVLSIYSKSNDLNKILLYTGNLDYTKDSNQLIKIRLETLKKLQSPYYLSEAYDWFTCRPISQEHYQFYRDTYDHPNFDMENVAYSPEQFSINYRIEVYKRNYIYTYEKAQQILRYIDEKSIPAKGYLASDIGKSVLYGNANYIQNAQLFCEYASKYKDTPMEHYFWFYAGRLFEKGGLYVTNTQHCFKNAIETSATPDQKDNALWYLLNYSLNTSFDSVIKTIREYSTQWTNASYFDDFFSTLLSSLLIAKNWTALYDIYTSIDGYATNETVAQYAYIYGRLVQEGLVKKEKTNRNPESDIQNAFTRALNADSATYYKLLAAYRLNLSDSEFADLIHKTSYMHKQNDENTAAADKFLRGCALFGFPDLIYPSWQEFFKKGVSTETAFYVANFLKRCSSGEDDYLHQSLRIAVRTAAYAEEPISDDNLKLIYPYNYKNFVEPACKKYNMEESVMLALIRSESFFDPDVTSTAGAIGLTQLMDFTGGDIARRLHHKEYSLEDPETNIEFGTFYLSELFRRCDGSYLQAFFSYNAGITRVRRWLQSSLVEFGKKKNVPMDLFLETLPYEETREYGRKLVSAAVMYEWLYSSEPPSYKEIISNLVQ